ncbi:hypothetical protein V5799_006987 [Amblyomma americanum]|uniref:Uncharacterized protein n=1 Tax=Amblyomma americanum TaxID=6943 RepID=A0AAQ4DUU0_AMBAM
MKTPSSSDKMERSAPQQPPLGDQQRIDYTIAPQARSPAEVFPPGLAAPAVSQEPLANYPLANNNNQLAMNQFANIQLEATGSAASHGGLPPAAYSGQQSPSAWPPSLREYMYKAGRRRRSSVEEGTTADAASGGASGESERKQLSERVDGVILSIIFMILVGLVAAALIISLALTKTSPDQGAEDHIEKGLELTETTTVIPEGIVVIRPRTRSSPTERTDISLDTDYPEYTETLGPDKGTRYPRPPETEEDSTSLMTAEGTESSWSTFIASDAPTSPGGSDDGSSSAYASQGDDTSAHGTNSASDFQEVDATPSATASSAG